jgi:hypothetical protein
MHGGKRLQLDEDSSIEEGELDSAQKQRIKNDLMGMYDDEDDEYGIDDDDDDDDDSDIAEAAATKQNLMMMVL